MSKKIDIEALKRDKEIFKVPEGYFDSLSSKIQARIKEEEEPDFIKAWIPKLAWAVPIVALILGFFALYDFDGPQTVDEMLASVSTEEMVQFLDLEDISEEELMAYIDQFEIGLELEFSDTEADLLNGLEEEDLGLILENYELNEDI